MLFDALNLFTEHPVTVWIDKDFIPETAGVGY